jgi:hypothetical protein
MARSSTGVVAVTLELPGPRPSTFDELADELRALGFDPTYAPGLEERGRGLDIGEILLRVWDQIDEATIGALMATVIGWTRRIRRSPSPPVMVKLYGPDGKVLKEVPVEGTE